MKNKNNWYSFEMVEKMLDKERISLTKEYVNPGMVDLFNMLGFDKVWADSAEGMYINLTNGKKILDMTGGNCVLGLGHNHPRIIEVRKKIGERKRLELCKSFLSPYMAALASNMANILPGDLQYSYFCNSGAEAIEAALKLAEKHHGSKRQAIAYTDHCFHGKTHAAMSVSSMDNSRDNFKLLTDCYQIEYGNAQELERLFKENIQPDGKTKFCAFVFEAIHGTRIIFPPKGYLKKVRELCNKHDVLMIVDEIYTGFGRTGKWFAFEREDVVPDIVCYSKTFGGGKATIAGITVRKNVFLKAYGSSSDCMMHSSTFTGMSEECATALEAVNVIRDEKLVEKAEEFENYLENELEKLKQKFPKYIKDVRGKGLLWGIELYPPLKEVEKTVLNVLPEKSPILSTLAGAIALSELFHSHNILAYLGFTRRNLIVLSPALIVKKEEIDTVIKALDDLFSQGWVKLFARFVKRVLSYKIRKA